MGVFATMPMWCRRLACRMVTLPVVLTRLCRMRQGAGVSPVWRWLPGHGPES